MNLNSEDLSSLLTKEAPESAPAASKDALVFPSGTSYVGNVSYNKKMVKLIQHLEESRTYFKSAS